MSSPGPNGIFGWRFGCGLTAHLVLDLVEEILPVAGSENVSIQLELVHSIVLGLCPVIYKSHHERELHKYLL